MIHISEAVNILNDGQVHKIEFVSKTKGTNSIIEKGIVLSSNYYERKFNIKSTISNQIRWVYYVLITKLDDKEVYQ